MPKIVDPTERLALIHRAAIGLILTGGVAHASLRNVAAESGLNIGSVRHYVCTTANLLRGVAESLSESAQARLAPYRTALQADLPPEQLFDLAVDLLCELVPLDEQRRTEAAVWLALVEHSRVHGDLGGAFDFMATGIRAMTGAVVANAGVADPELPAEALACSIDGLVVAMLAAPQDYPPETARSVVGWQLRAAISSPRS